MKKANKETEDLKEWERQLREIVAEDDRKIKEREKGESVIKSPEDLETESEGMASRAACEEHDRKTKKRQIGKSVSVSESSLIALGGVKTGSAIVFGRPDESQLIFEKKNKRVTWDVAYRTKATNEERKAVLKQAGRGLWNDKENTSVLALKAVESLEWCWNHLPDYPCTELEYGEALFAIGATWEALKRETSEDRIIKDGSKLRTAYRLLAKGEWPDRVEKLQCMCVKLALKLQRPPYKAELRAVFEPKHDPQTNQGTKEWGIWLKYAGLQWLPRKPKPRITRSGKAK